jgi:hypothetical protein
MTGVGKTDGRSFYIRKAVAVLFPFLKSSLKHQRSTAQHLLGLGSKETLSFISHSQIDPLHQILCYNYGIKIKIREAVRTPDPNVDASSRKEVKMEKSDEFTICLLWRSTSGGIKELAAYFTMVTKLLVLYKVRTVS